VSTRVPTPEPVIERGDTVTVGRKDYGWGVPATVITITVGSTTDTYLEFRNGMLRAPCGNCEGGSSGTKSYHANVFAGVCFQCTGRGWRTQVDDLDAAAKRTRTREVERMRFARKQAEAEAAAAAALAEWTAANADLAARLAEIADADNAADYTERAVLENRYDGGFVLNLAHTASYKPLTDKQTAAVAKAIAEADEAAAAKATLRHVGEPDETVTVTGTVADAFSFENRFRGWTWIVVVKADGLHPVKFFSSSKAAREAERGDKVTVTGTVKGHEVYEGEEQTMLTGRVKITTTTEE
jgi:hypothetical protein